MFASLLNNFKSIFFIKIINLVQLLFCFSLLTACGGGDLAIKDTDPLYATFRLRNTGTIYLSQREIQDKTLGKLLEMGYTFVTAGFDPDVCRLSEAWDDFYIQIFQKDAHAIERLGFNFELVDDRNPLTGARTTICVETSPNGGVWLQDVWNEP